MEDNKNIIKCKTCGADIAKKAKVCPACGAKNKKPVMRRPGIWVLIVIVIIIVAAVAGSGGGSKTPVDQTDGGSATTAQESSASEKSVPEEDVAEAAPAVIIGDCEYSEDYANEPTIIVNYEWTNTTNSTTSLTWAYTIKAYQNGVELNESYFSDDWLSDKKGMNASWVDSSRDVKPGSTIQTSIVYEIDDESSPIEIEVSEIFDADDVVTKKTFEPK
jgi:RNA polymerase subunit RPABC4/transcription elongation factor Spt4